MRPHSTLVVGAGPAGLAAALHLAEAGAGVTVCEQSDEVGGLARTCSYRGYRFDIGGHRFLTKVPEVQALWERALGDDFLTVRRLSRIYYRGRFFNYPLDAANVIRTIGVAETARIVVSYCQARLRPSSQEDSFEQWVTNRFGAHLYRTFFKSYTEKVWGIPCSEIRADWAAQRIRGLSAGKAVANALFGSNGVTSLAEAFRYPRYGPGQMWTRFAGLVRAAGGDVLLGARVAALRHRMARVTTALVEHDGRTTELPVAEVVTSMPVTSLLRRLEPAPPASVLAAAASLRYRDFILVPLIVDRADVFPDNWIYVHAPESRVGRIQNFKNWSAAMVADGRRTCLGLEYFCSFGDDLWSRSDSELCELASREVVALGFAAPHEILDGCVIRQRKAYPVYDAGYRAHVSTIREYLDTFENLQTIGRNGMHRYNNQDHSMLTGILAARNVLGERHDLWDVNTDRSYHEEQRVARLRVG